MLRPGQTAEAQHKMVYDVLAGLMTPVMPPIYKTFMTGLFCGSRPTALVEGLETAIWGVGFSPKDVCDGSALRPTTDRDNEAQDSSHHQTPNPKHQIPNARP